MNKTNSNTKNNKKQSKDDTIMKKSNTKNDKQSQEKTMDKNEVTTGSAATIASASTCNTVSTDIPRLCNEMSKSLVTPYALDRRYFFEDDHVFQKLFEQSDNKIVSRMAIMLYADCVAWNRDVFKFYHLSNDISNNIYSVKEFIKFGYGIVARRDLFFPMFVKIDRAEVTITRCYDDIESYTIDDIRYIIEDIQFMIDDTVSIIIEYGYKYPEVIFAMEVVNSYVM